jgi:3-hydroxyacyl-[acyl-carrier-protein] dehydratase
MLKDTFFSISDSADIDDGRIYRIALNDSHPIFQAHFAGNPIMPGACVVQLIKELAADYFNRTLIVCTVKSMKFLHPVNPLETPELSVRMNFTPQEDGRMAVSSILSRDDIVFSKSFLVLGENSILPLGI